MRKVILMLVVVLLAGAMAQAAVNEFKWACDEETLVSDPITGEISEHYTLDTTGQYRLKLQSGHSIVDDDPFGLPNSGSLSTPLGGAGYAIHQPMTEMEWVDSGQLTLEMWMKPLGDGETNRNVTIQNNSGSTTYVYLQREHDTSYATDDYLKFRFYVQGVGSGHTHLPDVKIPTNEWTHVAMVYNYDYLDFYVNGQNVQSYVSDTIDPTNGVNWLRRTFPDSSTLDFSAGITNTGGSGTAALEDDIGVYGYALDSGDLGYYASYTPEPATLALLSIGIVAIRRRK